jgi:glycosyltransferase involved in cell wall biosynthesis
MRILEITNYTRGGCGVGMRVLKESKLLSERGHKVMIFSTNHVKGSKATCPSEEKIGNVEIRRFPAKKLGLAGDSYMVWDFTKSALSFRPDVIIAHSYRHPHTTQVLKIARKLGCRAFLVTHAPFGREQTRSGMQNIGVKVYDSIIGKKVLKKFDKIIAITFWELPYLEKLGVPKSRIAYIPNGIDEEFFRPIKRLNKIKKAAYLGRVAPIKQIETMVEAASSLDIEFLVMGPAESDYSSQLKNMIKKKNIKNISLVNQPYSSHEQIGILDKSDIFILPSKSEGMPQTLIEAMARGKIVAVSNNAGNLDLVNDGENGFIFENGNPSSLAEVLKYIQSLSLPKLHAVQKEARRTAEKFKWAKLIDNMEKMIDGI